jgi:hypothetical protein
VSGTIEVQFRSTWSDSNGSYARPLDEHEVDVVCIYCPDTRACYYVDPKRFGRSVSSRVTPSRNRQGRNVLLADGFRAMPASVGSRRAEAVADAVTAPLSASGRGR